MAQVFQSTQTTQVGVAQGMVTLLALSQKLRAAQDEKGLGYIVVNETQLLLPCRQALLWRGGRVVAATGVPKPQPEAPFVIWAGRLMGWCQQQSPAAPLRINVADLPAELAEQWEKHLPSNALWVPLKMDTASGGAGLLLARDESWREEELRVGDHWGEVIAHAWGYILVQQQSWLQRWSQRVLRRRWLIVFACCALLMFFPVRQSVLAPAEVVPQQPTIIRAPQDGVIDKVVADPNQPVAQGDLLLTLDDIALKSRLDVALQTLEVARAEYRRAEQGAVSSRDASVQLPVLASRIRQYQSEVEYVQTLLQRVAIHAKRNGLALYTDRRELEGKPVKVGEKVMVIAAPDEVELEAWLPVADSIHLEDGAKIEFFLNIAPGRPLSAHLERINYQAEVSPEGYLAFRVRARLDETELPRIGLHGTARIYGDHVVLGYYLFRRPLAAARQWLGL